MAIPEQIVVPVCTAPAAQHRTANRQFQGIPGIAVTPNGFLWATWYAGGIHEGPDNFVVVVVSTDGGATWSDTVAVVDPPGRLRAFDSTLWFDPAGRLWLFWAQCNSLRDGNIFDGASGVWGSYTTAWTRAAPGAWSTPVRLANGVMMNKPTVLHNSDWAYPTAVWNNLGGATVCPELKGEQLSNLVVSHDRGRSYERVGGADIPERAFDEHMIIELRDGRLWLLARTFYGIGESFSADGGKTWSPGRDSKLGGPNSRFHIRRLASGRLLLINHQTDPANKFVRKLLTAYLSSDEGATWQGGLVLDERNAVSYPDADQDASGFIYAIHDRERYQEGEILLSGFREEDVLAGSCVTPGAFLKRVVDRSGGVRTVAP